MFYCIVAMGGHTASQRDRSTIIVTLVVWIGNTYFATRVFFLPYASFGLQVLSLPASVCLSVRPSVCVCGKNVVLPVQESPSHDRLIFIMETPYWKDRLYIETGSSWWFIMEYWALYWCFHEMYMLFVDQNNKFCNSLMSEAPVVPNPGVKCVFQPQLPLLLTGPILNRYWVRKWLMVPQHQAITW